MRNILVALCGALALSLPAAARSVTCKDGTTSTAGKGACSHHGGVATEKAEKSTRSEAKKDAKTDKGDRADKETKADKDAKTDSGKSGGVLGGLFGKKSTEAQGRSSNATPRSSTRESKSGSPTAKCKDGTMSYSAHHSGTCSGHGGVAEWLDK